jgi:hypothetical protein
VQPASVRAATLIAYDNVIKHGDNDAQLPEFTEVQEINYALGIACAIDLSFFTNREQRG